MNIKPDRKTAILNIINLVRNEFPFDSPVTQICGESCIGCPRKLLELIETEIIYFESRIEEGDLPNLTEISRFAKLCKNVRRGLIRNGLIKD